MANKKETKKPIEKAQAAAKEKREKRKSALAERTYKFVKDADRTEEQLKVKLAPQEQAIIETVKANGAKGVKRPELIEQLKTGGKLVTKQPPERILGYYEKHLSTVANVIAISEPPKE